MKIEIKSGDELNLLLEALKTEITNANSYHRLFLGLIKSRPAHEREFQQSEVFWHLTQKALMEARLINLCRVYDQHSVALNLVNLLETIKANLHFFSEADFRKRLKGNAFVDYLAKDSRIPQLDDIERDIKSVSCKQESVKKLMIWRNNIAAHYNAQLSLRKNQVLEDNPLSEAEIEQLLEHSLTIFNKYSSLYNNSGLWREHLWLGQDDFKSLLKFMGLGLKKWDEGKKEIQHQSLASKN